MEDGIPGSQVDVCLHLKQTNTQNDCTSYNYPKTSEKLHLTACLPKCTVTILLDV